MKLRRKIEITILTVVLAALFIWGMGFLILGHFDAMNWFSACIPPFVPAGFGVAVKLAVIWMP